MVLKLGVELFGSIFWEQFVMVYGCKCYATCHKLDIFSFCQYSKETITGLWLRAEDHKAETGDHSHMSSSLLVEIELNLQTDLSKASVVRVVSTLC